jgi:putative transposase
MSKRFRKLSHSLYECKYHIIFCPKYRYRILQGEIREWVRGEIIRLMWHKEGLELIELNVQAERGSSGDVDTTNICRLKCDGVFERETGGAPFSTVRETAEEVFRAAMWSRGNCVSTIGIDEEKIRQYVRWQEEKDRETEKIQGELFNEDEE